MPVNTKLKVVEDAEDDLELVSALWGGTRAMRKAGTTYLPQEPGEETEDYKNRKARTTLTNIFKKTVTTFAGRLFEDEVTILDQPELDDFVENVDLEGRDFHRFSHDLARFALRDGMRYILVDAPVAADVKTKADEQAQNIRPYFMEIDRRNVLGWKSKTVGSQRVVTQFRILEKAEIGDDEFSSKEVDQIRVIEPNIIRLYRKNQQGDWVFHEEIPTSIDFVPIVPVYADRQGYMGSVPPLMDIAWLNVEHWQKSSDQSNILHVARVPILHWAGYKPSYDEEGKSTELVVGPNTLAKSASESARLEYVEHSGAAIEAGRQDLLDIEDRMTALGAEYTSPKKSGSITATEKAINESGDISELSAFSQNLKDSLTVAMGMVTKMMGTKFTGSVSLKTDLGIIKSPVDIVELVKIRANGDISREGMYDILNDEWDTILDAEVEADRIDNEMPAIGGGGGTFGSE